MSGLDERAVEAHPHIRREEVATKISEMLRVDAITEWGKGYRAAVAELREWLEQMARERGTTPDPGVRLSEAEIELSVSALQFASTYAAQPDLKADDLAARLEAELARLREGGAG